MTTKEAAAHLGLNHRTVGQYIRRGRLVAERRIVRGLPEYHITEDELERFRQERQIGPGNKTGKSRRPTRKREEAHNELDTTLGQRIKHDPAQHDAG